MMPKLSGFQLLQALRENKKTCHLPIVLLSARGGEEAQLEGLKMVFSSSSFILSFSFSFSLSSSFYFYFFFLHYFDVLIIICL